jgi:hypothetical protein
MANPYLPKDTALAKGSYLIELDANFKSLLKDSSSLVSVFLSSSVSGVPRND